MTYFNREPILTDSFNRFYETRNAGVGMGRDAREWIKSLPAKEQAAIERRAAELKTEQAAFRDAQALGREALTQVADELGVSVGELDRMIAASDRYYEVLQERAAAAGGAISLHVDMPGHASVVAERLRDLHDVDDETLETGASANRRTG